MTYEEGELSLAEVIDELVSLALSTNHAGWEINEGSNGSIRITEKGLKINHNQFETITHSSSQVMTPELTPGEIIRDRLEANDGVSVSPTDDDDDNDGYSDEDGEDDE